MYKTLKIGSYALVIIGALNWGLVGFFKFNLVNFLLHTHPTIENIVYDLVGLAAIVSVITAYKCCKE